MVYECGTEDLRGLDYMVIPPQKVDIAGIASRCWAAQFILRLAAKSQNKSKGRNKNNPR